ncbi:Adaptive-response+sensory-kinase+SasA [Methylocapsa aurea]|uniref:sensor histidine kinase n=1 Tax=Methylocapsa aurea TaxID=663610 RepID=UPI003D189A44
MQTVDIRTSIVFRRTLAIVVLFIASYLAIFGYIYLQMTELEVSRVKNLLEQQARAFLLAPTDQIQWSLDKHIFVGLRQVTFSALFDSELHYIEGNVRTFPNSLPIDGAAHLSSAGTSTDDSQAPEPTLFVALRLPDSRILLIGKSILYLGKLKETVIQALKIGVLPMAVIAIGVGALFSQRINYRLSRAQSTMSLYQQGQLDRRLPVTRNRDELDIFSEQVNSLLAELEHVVGELHQVGNNIAHDLRTPLARVRANLEKAQRSVTESDPSFVLIARAIQGLDQTFALTTALLRISQLESGKARASFCAIDLRDLIDEAADLYGPVAEAKDIDLTVEIHPVPPILGDRDLLLEAVANLLDNAIKFSPDHGNVKISLENMRSMPTVSIADDGPGVPAKDKGQIFKRFYRCSQSAHISGNGIGLTLVLAIVQLHNFTIDVEDGSPGSVFRLFCVPQTFPPNAQSSA